MRNDHFFVYILTSSNGNVMYIGITNDLIRRVTEHKSGMIDGFTKRYHIHKLVYYEMFGDVREAIMQRKAIEKLVESEEKPIG